MKVAQFGHLAVAAIVALLLGCSNALADEFDILKGKSIRAVIGTTPGNINDATARAFLAALGRVLPETTIRSQNIEGAGGAAALREVQTARGETIAIVANGPIYAEMMAPEGVPSDLSRMRWIGSLIDNQRLLFIRKGLGGTSLETLYKLGRQPIAASSDAVSPSTIEALMLSAMTGLRLKVVPGVSDAMRDTMLLAGNVDVNVSGYSARRQLIETGVVIPVLRLGDGSYPDAVKSLPRIADVVREGVPAELVYFMEGLNRIGLLVGAAPATDPAVVSALGAAFEKAVADSDYKSQLAANGQTSTGSTSGAELAEIMRRLFDGNAGLRASIKAYRECGQRISDGLATDCR
jgi:tripartite-type tricarboxylate transporter receptor subunit TctC